ncbi:MAG: LLM class flavin-dependent oxidoreductase [Acidobacteriota bacterium]|nr:LLM class flavin-dependent oxidoreductase [Acidobacteriota bacterium]
MNQALRFHWSLSQAGNSRRRSIDPKKMSGLPSLEAQEALCRKAESCGIETMLMAIGFTRPDPLLLATSLGLRTKSIGFMVACRAGLVSPTLFTQQLNTLSQLLLGRICINMVSGHTPGELRGYGDFQDHDARYRRTAEFLAVCRGLWRQKPFDYHGEFYRVEQARVHTPFHGGAPEIFVGGNSEEAFQLAAEHADCLWRFPDAPEVIAAESAPLLRTGTQVGLLVSLIARPTREQAHAAARASIKPFSEETLAVHRNFANKSDARGFRSVYRRAEHADAWITPTLWTGAVPYLGAPAIALVGSYDDIARDLWEYREAGVRQFLFMGRPDIEEMDRFGRQILPRIRARERVSAGGAA